MGQLSWMSQVYTFYLAVHSILLHVLKIATFGVNFDLCLSIMTYTV